MSFSAPTPVTEVLYIFIFRYFVQITAIKSADISGRQYYELKLKEPVDSLTVLHWTVLCLFLSSQCSVKSAITWVLSGHFLLPAVSGPRCGGGGRLRLQEARVGVEARPVQQGAGPLHG